MKYVGLVLVLLAACASDDGGGGGGGGCSVANDTCDGETVCVNSSCVAAFPRVYNIGNIRVMLPTTDPTGAAWDIGGGAPDILVEVRVNGTLAGTTSTVQDQFSATFAAGFDATLVGGSTVTLDVYDEDATVNDKALTCTGTVTSAFARSRELACTSMPTTVVYTLTAK